MVSFAVCVGKILYGVVMVWPVAVEVIAIVYELSCNRKHARIHAYVKHESTQLTRLITRRQPNAVSQSVSQSRPA